ncbi:hypothetical protein SAMN04488688_10382 [Paenibacillus sp. cl141a]|nr:hypothetical protein SAMN04488688_10382 [Paenibacillus sp. cl141a]
MYPNCSIKVIEHPISTESTKEMFTNPGLIKHNGPKPLSPKAQMTRAEVTALIARMLKVTDLIDK